MLLLQDSYKEPFPLLNSFWVKICVEGISIKSLVKVRGYLDKIEKGTNNQAEKSAYPFR